MPVRLLEPTLAPAISDAFVVSTDPATPDNVTLPACFRAPGLIKGDKACVVQYQDANGEWHPVWMHGEQALITDQNSFVCLYAPGTYRVFKQQTQRAVGVDVATETNP